MNDKEKGAHESTDAYLDAYVMSSKARVEFGLSRALMTKLLAGGRLPFEPDPLDKRTKWVKRRDVLEITGQSGIHLRRQRQQQQRQLQRQSQQPPPEPPPQEPPQLLSPPLAEQLTERRSAHAPVPNANHTARKQMRIGKLHPSDKVMLDFLTRLCAATGKDYTPPVGIHTISERCDISQRTVQTCGDRLIAANRIERVGYDVGNRDRAKRGMVYRVLGIQQNALYSGADIATVVE
jgi:hypothetical protein